MKKTIRSIIQLSIVLLVMVLALISVHAQTDIEQVSKSYFNTNDKFVIDFEDASPQPGLQYWETKGVKFTDSGITNTIRIEPANRNNAATASGKYSIFSDGIFPATSANVPLNIVFKEGVSAVGFYAGNGKNNQEQVTATITVYDKEDNILASFTKNDITDAVTSFIGIRSNSNLIYKVSLDYGSSLLGEELDDVQFIKGEPSITRNNPTQSSTFSVSVNDYPDHKDNSKTKSIALSYVNMYTTILNGNGFKVTSVETKQTGTIDNPTATFSISPNQMVYFEGFKTNEGAQNGAAKKLSLLWNEPPYKNFGTGNNQLCQTHYTETDQFLQHSKEYACTTALSIPYQDIIKVIDNNDIDLSVSSLTYDTTAFKATICNQGTKAVTGFEVKFTANNKNNLLTYAPTLNGGSCTQIYSWGYTYFADDKEGTPSIAVVTVDPSNNIIESNENNNVAQAKLTAEASTPKPLPTALPSESNWVWKKAIFKNRQSIENGYEYDIVPTDILPASNSECIKDFDSSICLEKVHLLINKEGTSDYITLFANIEGISDTQTLGFETNKNEYNSLSFLNTPKVSLSFNPSTLKLRVIKKQSPTLDSNLVLNINSEIKGAYLDWNDVAGFGSTFDKYNIRFKKGIDLQAPIANSYVSYGSYYNLVELTPGEQWTFQVCPTKDKEIVGSCSNIVTVSVKDGKLDLNNLNFKENVQVESINTIKLPLSTTPGPESFTPSIEPPYNSPIKCTSGCDYNSKCLSVGTRVQGSDKNYYCNWNNELKTQQAVGTSCQNNYECGTNSCTSGQCLDLQQTLAEQQTLMEKILRWFNRVFG